MRETRRAWLKGGGAALVSLGLAGCTDSLGGGSDPESDDSSSPESTESTDDSGGGNAMEPADAAVAAEWNAIRARVWDALALGRAGDTDTGAAVAGDVFARFERASGEHNAHETLEATSESNYAEFEEALGELRTAGLEADDVGRAAEEAAIASTQLHEAQRTLVGDAAAQALDLQLLGGTLQDAVALALADDFEAAATVAEGTATRFDEAAVSGTLESADAETADAFADAVEGVVSAAAAEDAEGVRSSAGDALAAAVDGAYAIAPSEAVAGAGHVATYQASGWDAAALANRGGPSTAFAHAAALNGYRTRVRDAAWLFERDRSDAAKGIVENVFAHFEEARAHEALEEASEDAYQRFEHEGLEGLTTAIENDDSEGVANAVETIDAALVDGIEALGTGVEPALLEAGFFKARIEDALERYRLGENEVAAEIARGLFETFEANEADFHETLEETDESLYEAFEHDHLEGLISAFEDDDGASVDEHATGIRETLLAFETTAGTTARVSAVESGYMAARVFDAGVVDVLGGSDRAETITQEAFTHFEGGAGGFHEALEAADHELYEAFEAALEAAGRAAGEGDDVSAAARAFDDRAVEAIYAVVASAGGSFGGAAASIVQDAFARFEEARVHERLEEADRDAYEGFEAALTEYVGALDEGAGVNAAATSFATAALRAQFAVAGAPDAAPVDDEGGEGHGGEPELRGGPNVVEGVPEDADHVVEMHAVAFEPAELTVQQGETVAWPHVGGEPHSVTAYGDAIPDEAEYWASGDFDGEDAAREGWEEGKGAIQSGESYVRTFETTGEHEYVCIPHEAAGMVGTIVVE